MRRTLSCVLMMTLLLTGCAGGKGEETAENLAARIRTEYLALAGWAATVDITADYGERVYEFTLDALWQKDGDTVLTVTRPELVAGITARIRDGEGYLEYDGASLSTGPLTGDGMSPMEALPYMMKEVKSGYMARAFYVGEGAARELHVLCRDPEGTEGQGAECLLRFDPVTHALLGGEVLWDGFAVLRAEISEFTKKEMTDIDTGNNANLGGSESGQSGT